MKPNVVLAFFNTLERTSQLLAKGDLEEQRSSWVSGDKETYKSAEEWIWGFFYQGITEVKILKRTAESSDAQRTDLSLQEHCTQSRIRNKAAWCFCKLSSWKNITVLNTNPASHWEVCHLLQKLIILHYLFFIKWCGKLFSCECLARWEPSLVMQKTQIFCAPKWQDVEDLWKL